MIPFPEAMVGEWTAWSRGTASGLLLHRHAQALDLLSLPDFSLGDLDEVGRREALDRHVEVKTPLTALSLFLGVVALEDYVRDFGARLAENEDLTSLFPELTKLALKQVVKPNRPVFARTDSDAYNYTDPEQLNGAFLEAIGIAPIPPSEHPKLRDLALLRHTVAHHASVIRAVDVTRFQFYEVYAGQSINPPSSFVKETLRYLWRVSRAIEVGVRNVVFARVLEEQPLDWWREPPPIMLRLFDFFGYFGFLETAQGPVGYISSESPYYERAKAEGERITASLIGRCVAELRAPTQASATAISDASAP
jgi:hypothetical protein